MAYKVKKDSLKPPTATKGTILKLVSLALTFLMVPILCAIIDPVLIVAKFMSRIANGSEIYNLLGQELDIIHVSTYLFNITNKEEFLSGKDKKIKLEEVGPFTYREMRKNEEMDFDPKDGVLRYTPRVRAEFVPEESVGHPKDYHMVMPNIAMLSLTSMASTYPVWTRLGYHLLVQRSNSKSTVELDAESYLWGYDEPLVKFGNTFMPGWINFNTMGIMDRMYDKKANHRLEVGATNAHKFQIKTMDGHGGLSVWDYDDPNKRSRCNTFEDSYEGLAFPPDLTPKTPLRIYRNILCRVLDLDYIGSRYMDYGGETFMYKISNKSFTRSPENDCLCSRGVCQEGISDLSPCFYDLPFALSAAHFLDTNPDVYNRVEGMKPDPKKHSSLFDIDPKVGVVVNTKFAVQLNINLRDLDFNVDTKPFSNMVLPIAYYSINTPVMQPEQKAKMVLLYTTGPKIKLSILIILSSIGLLILSYSMRLMYWNWICSDGKGIAFQVPQDGKSSAVLPLVGYEDT